MARDDKRENALMKAIRDAARVDSAADNFLGFADSTYPQIQDIRTREDRFREVITRQDEVMNGQSGGLIMDFVQMLQNNPATRSGGYGRVNKPSTLDKKVDITEQLKVSASDLMGYFSDLYQNRFIEMSDLMFIAKFIPALGEAVKAINDAVVSSDDTEGTLSRSIEFNASVPEQAQKQVRDEIDRIEREKDLHKKLKNIVFKNTLISGEYYIYAIPYRELFEQYSKDRAEQALKQPFQTASGMEGVDYTNDTWQFAQEGLIPFDIDVDGIIEQIKEDDITNATSENNKDKYAALAKDLKSHASVFTFIDTPILEEALPDVAAMESVATEGGMPVNDPKYVGTYTKYFGQTPVQDIPDSGIASIGKGNTMLDQYKAETGFNVDDVYIRYIAPKFMIPIKLMDEVIGYYYITAKDRKRGRSSNLLSNSVMPQSTMTPGVTGVFSAVAITDQRRNAIVDSIIDNMTRQILQRFNKKFVAANANFRKTIADVITYNGYLDKEYHVQFIPSKYVIEFKIDADADDHGTSVLSESLFPAKLELSLIVSRMLNYMNKAADRTIVYLTKGKIDTHTGNHTQRLIRNIQEGDITFSDLLSTNLVFNKFGRNKNIVMSKSPSGNRLAEFETQEGMNVEMNPEYENMLEQKAILGTGVPSVIMEFVGQSDFAKGFENGNIKFASRVASLQGDLEPSLTQFYQVLVENSGRLNEDVKEAVRNKFRVCLSRPRALIITNNNEFLGNLQSVLQIITNVLYGENSDGNDAAERTEFTRLAVRKYAPNLNWDDLEKMKEAAALAKKGNIDTGNDAAGGGGF